MNENVNFKLQYTQEDQTTASIYFEVQSSKDQAKKQTQKIYI